MTLPQPEISVFSADPVEYSDFVRAFENLIESKTSRPNSRLYYLVQYTSGEVKEAARSLLKDRYGQSYKIATALIDRVTKTPQIKSDDGPAFQRYSVLLTSCKNSLKHIGYLSKIENPDTLQRIIGRLPLWLKKKRLLKDPELHGKYSLFMEDLFDKGKCLKINERVLPHGTYLITPSFIHKSPTR